MLARNQWASRSRLAAREAVPGATSAKAESADLNVDGDEDGILGVLLGAALHVVSRATAPWSPARVEIYSAVIKVC